MSESIDQRYQAAGQHGGYFRNEQRSLIQVTGADRASWLHNLTTNTISTLQPGDGNYAFAVTIQGRTVCDLNCLIFEDQIWIDIDRRWKDEALAHLTKYLVVEDVQTADITADWARVDILGRETPACIERLGFGNNFGAYADLQHSVSQVDGHSVHVVKGVLGPISHAVLYVPQTGSDAVCAKLERVASELGMGVLEDDLATIIRIEAGHPASVDDIDGEVIPPETMQVERGINYVKGCYLGQEVIERMRSRNSMARRLVGMKISGSTPPPRDAWVFADTKQIGRVTSSCHSVALDSILALGYVKTSLTEDGGALRVALNETEFADVELVDMPLSSWKSSN